MDPSARQRILQRQRENASRNQRNLAKGVAGLVVLGLIIRDRARRASGLERRSPQMFLVSALWRLNTRASRFLANYAARHRSQTYIALIVGAVLLLKYQQRLRRWWRRVTTPTSKDVLTEYPADEAEDEAKDGVVENQPAQDKMPLRLSPSRAALAELADDPALANLPPGASGSGDIAGKPGLLRRGGSIGSRRGGGGSGGGASAGGGNGSGGGRGGRLGDDSGGADSVLGSAKAAGLEVAAAFRASITSSGGAADHGAGGPGGSASMRAHSRQLDKSVMHFLRHMTNVTQSMDEVTTASLYERMELVEVRKGEVLFSEGDLADDGMYTVVTGKIGIYVTERPPGSTRGASAGAGAGAGAGAAGRGGSGTSTADAGTDSDPDTNRSSPGAASLDSLRHEIAGYGTPLDSSVGSLGDNSNGRGSGGASKIGAGFGFGLGGVPGLGLPIGQGGRAPRKSVHLCSFGPAQTVGENALLAGPGARRAISARAQADCQLLRLDRKMFEWFLDQYPHAIVSFILTTTARQWRVAYFTLVDFLDLPGAWKLAVEPSEPAFDPESPEFEALRSAGAGYVHCDAGDALYSEGDVCTQLYVLKSGRASCFATVDGMTVVTRDLEPGSVAGGAACIVGLPHRETVRCLEPCVFVPFSSKSFATLAASEPTALSSGRRNALVDIVMAVARSLTPLLVTFLELGLQRLWLHAGEVLFRQGDTGDSMYVVISGRLRTMVHAPDGEGSNRGSRSRSFVGGTGSGGGGGGGDTDHEEDFDFGARRRAHARTVGGRNRSEMSIEVGRGECVGELSVLTSGDSTRDNTCVALRDCELVRLSRSAFSLLATRHPAVMQLFTRLIATRYQDMQRRLSTYSVHGGRHVGVSRAAASNLVTLALIPAGRRPPNLRPFAEKLVRALQKVSGGPVLHLTSAKLDEQLGEGTGASLSSLFARSKVGAWISTQEEAHRFVVFEADPACTAWSKMCVRQTDCVLLVGDGASSDPGLSEVERDVLYYRTSDDPSEVAAAAAAAAARKRAGTGGGDAGALGKDDKTSASALRRLVRRANSSPNVFAGVLDAVTGAKGKGKGQRAAGDDAEGIIRSRTLSRKELVLVHPDPSRPPRGTRNWLRLRRVGCHHHIRSPMTADFERIARHLCGTATGVVFGGGGARGLAHLGVLEAMDEQGLPVDFIGGTSQGAFMAACYAMTLDVKECVPLARHLAGAIGSLSGLLSDATLPLVSYFSGANFNEALQDVFGDTQIEDLWLRYFCISTNVTHTSMGVHETGPLWRYTRASMTVLGLLPPLLDNGDLLVDGGYVNNLPVDVMREFAPATVVAVDVEDKDNSLFENVHDYGDSLSGWWLAWKVFLSWLRLSEPVRIPRTPDVALTLAYISHSMALKQLMAQGAVDDSIVYIMPEVQGFKLLDYDKIDAIVERGRKMAQKKLRAWRRRKARHRDSVARGGTRRGSLSGSHASTSGGRGGGGGGSATGLLDPDLAVGPTTSGFDGRRHSFSMMNLHRLSTAGGAGPLGMGLTSEYGSDGYSPGDADAGSLDGSPPRSSMHRRGGGMRESVSASKLWKGST